MPANNVEIISYDKFSLSSSSSDEEYTNYRKVDTSDDERIQFLVLNDFNKSLKKDNEEVHFESLPRKDHHENFLRKCTDIILKEAVFDATKRSNKVTNFKSPDELSRLFDFNLNKSASSHDKLVKIVKDTILYSVKTGHPYFVNQLFSSLDPYGLVGQWLTDALNPSVYTYEVSPVFTLMEETVLKEMRKIVGFEGGRGDGIFCPGGSIANGYAISCARHKHFPEVKVSRKCDKFEDFTNLISLLLFGH